MDRRWGVGREQAGEVSTRLDYEHAAGGGHGVATESTSLKLGSFKSSGMVGEGSRRDDKNLFRRNGRCEPWAPCVVRLYTPIVAGHGKVGNLWLSGKSAVENISGRVDSDPTGPQRNLSQRSPQHAASFEQ
jgi:hypothetical protein